MAAAEASASLDRSNEVDILARASARAQTGASVIREEGRAFATFDGIDNAPPAPGFQPIDISADAQALSAVSAPLTFAGGAGTGLVLMQV
jgi:hypothetical protein